MHGTLRTLIYVLHFSYQIEYFVQYPILSAESIFEFIRPHYLLIILIYVRQPTHPSPTFLSRPAPVQRLAFSRLLTNMPSTVFLDEATSALDEANEAKLYAWVQASAADAFVSVGHRASLFRWAIRFAPLIRFCFHDVCLSLCVYVSASARITIGP